MNWKPTLVFGILFGAALAAWALLRPAPSGPAGERERPFSARADEFTRLEIQVPGQPEVVLERAAAKDAVPAWRIREPIDQPADDTRVADMIQGLRRLTRDGSIAPSDPRYSLAEYGLEKPLLSVHAFVGADKKAIRFGRTTVDPQVRYFMIDGEPDVYLGPADAFEAFHAKLIDLRSRKIAHFQPQRVRAFVLETKFLRPLVRIDEEGNRRPVWELDEQGKPKVNEHGQKIPKQEVVYERTEFQFRERPETPGGLRGWSIVRADGEEWNEPADAGRLELLISDLRDATADEFIEPTSLAAYGLEYPEVRCAFELADSDEPLVFEFGNVEEREGRKRIYVRVRRAGEILAVSGALTERLGRRRGDFRSRDVYDFTKEEIESIELVSETGRLKIQKEVQEEKGDEGAAAGPVWKIVEPADFRKDKYADIESYISLLLRAQIAEFMGRQTDLKSFFLDPPGLSATFRLKYQDGSTSEKTYRFGYPGAGANAHLLKPGRPEVFAVSSAYWRSIERMDLHLRDPAMFDLPRDAIREIHVDIEGDRVLKAVRYGVRKNEQGDWEFLEPSQEKVDADRMAAMLARVNYIRAESFLSRSPAIAREYGLDGPDPYGRLTIRYAPDRERPSDVRERTIRFSRAYPDDRRRHHLYYAKLEPAAGEPDRHPDVMIVFRISGDFVDMLREGVAWVKTGDPGHRPIEEPGGHDHEDEKPKRNP
ncbi:MAG: DUF4340 domain-containing protein [Planctomycetes bacterium]|nr:DUF4340 domain-containing protein [Planctomycetota bacterium]